ncbi:MAG: glycoside hydrolase family 76 protein [Fimbriimonas sp.]
MFPIIVGATVAATGDLDAKTFRTWGAETLATIRRDFSMPHSKLLGEEIVAGERPKVVAFNWGVGVMLSALNAAARVDPQYRPWLREYADATRVYWNAEGPIPGYDVLPSPKPVDRYYDDNAWMVLSLVETFEVLGDRKYLGWAEDTLKYVLSGEDERLGGGIYWKEAEKSSKNTCSNGPAAAAALAVFVHLRKPEYLEVAKRIYAWTQQNLQDPADRLYWDCIKLDGEIDRTKWTYNTGLMLRTAVDLYRETKDDRYRQDAAVLDDASARQWLDPETGALKDDGKFAHLLLENWARRVRVTKQPSVWPHAGVKALAYVYAKGKDAEGRYGHRWENAASGLWPQAALIDQASAARAYFVAADALHPRR